MAVRREAGAAALGCLLIGSAESDFLNRIERRLTERGASVSHLTERSETLDAARSALYGVSHCGRVCIVAEKDGWVEALALSVQLNVDRVVIRRPTELEQDRLRMWSFVRRNLFFCVSSILALEEQSVVDWDVCCRGLCNARLWRIADEYDAQEHAMHFLTDEGETLFPGKERNSWRGFTGWREYGRRLSSSLRAALF